MGLTSISQKDGIIQTNATKTLGLSNAPEVVTFVDHKKRNKVKVQWINDWFKNFRKKKKKSTKKKKTKKKKKKKSKYSKQFRFSKVKI